MSLSGNRPRLEQFIGLLLNVAAQRAARQMTLAARAVVNIHVDSAPAHTKNREWMQAHSGKEPR